LLSHLNSISGRFGVFVSERLFSGCHPAGAHLSRQTPFPGAWVRFLVLLAYQAGARFAD
jgi:hypothetical protein